MKHIKLKISKIVDELIKFCFSIGSKNIDINIDECDEYYKIAVKSCFDTKDINKIKSFIKRISYGKHEEIEEYYWYLAGETDINNEFALLGAMVDKCDINIVDENKIEIEIIKNK